MSENIENIPILEEPERQPILSIQIFCKDELMNW